MLLSLLDDPPNCPAGWDYYNNHCFYVSSDAVNQPSARLQCQAMNAELASISDSLENDFVASILLVIRFSVITVYHFIIRISLHLNEQK